MKDILYKSACKTKHAKLSYKEKVLFRNIISEISVANGSYYKNTDRENFDGRRVNRTKLFNNKYIYWVNYPKSIEVLDVI